MPLDTERHNLALRETRKEKLNFDKETLVFIAFPVYGGLPKIAKDVFACLQGDGAPRVYTAVRGDTEPGGFYWSMDDPAKEAGFSPGAVASVAEHTLMPSVSHGRPDSSDAEPLGKFGQQALERANDGKTLSSIHGERKPIPDFAFYPIGDADVRIRCGQRVENCPGGAIPDDEPYTQDNEICIMRCAPISVRWRRGQWETIRPAKCSIRRLRLPSRGCVWKQSCFYNLFP